MAYKLNRDCGLLITICLSFAFATRSDAQIFTHLDFTEFQTRLDEVATSSGIASFSTAERTTIEMNILSSLNSAFSDFSVTFTDTDPGGARERLIFGATTTSTGLFGQAAGIDWRNQRHDESADVYTANFAGFIESGESRSQQISELSLALAGTAAHELGHNLGLRHQDSYGEVTFTGPAIDTGGLQNQSIMATGATGLSEVERETARTFSTHSKVKLAYGDLLTDSTPMSVDEASSDAGDTFMSALALVFEDLSVVDRRAVNVVASHLSGTDTDFYSFFLEAGSTLSVDINNELFASDTFLNVFDASMDMIASNDDVFYNGDIFGDPSGTMRADDSLLYNIPILSSGTYFVEVANNGGSGDYDLLIHTNFSSVPEPASILMLMVGAVAVTTRRRRIRRTQT